MPSLRGSTGLVVEDESRQGMWAGACGCLRKPFDHGTFAITVLAAFASRPPPARR